MHELVDGAVLPKVICEVSYAAYELTMVVGIVRAERDQVRHRAAVVEQYILDPRITAVDDDRVAQIGVGLAVLVIRDAVIVGVGVRAAIQSEEQISNSIGRG